MTNFKLLYIIAIGIFSSFNGNKHKVENNKTQIIELTTYTSKMSANHKSNFNQTNLTLEDFILAFEKQIKFYKTETKENLIEFLGISKGRVNSISDKEFNELVRDENVYLFENLIDALKNNKIEFKVAAQENNIFKVAFKEKGNDDFLSIIINFKNTKDGLVVTKKTND